MNINLIFCFIGFYLTGLILGSLIPHISIWVVGAVGVIVTITMFLLSRLF